MSETNDQPGTPGVGGEADAAHSDDTSTELYDRMEAPDDGDDEDDSGSGEAGENGEGDKPDAKAGADDDSEEIEVDGIKARVPKALKDAFLRHGDYTRKTQELGEHRRALETERTTWEAQREESRAALPEEHAKVAVINHNIKAVDTALAEFREIDWERWQRQVQDLASDDPSRLRYQQYRDQYYGLRDRKVSLDDQLAEAKTDLQTKEDARLSSGKEAAATALRTAQEETGRILAAEIKGWNPEVAGKTVEFMTKELGVTLDEVAHATDPRTWKMAHELMTSRARIATLEASVKQHQKASGNLKAQETKPADTTKGAGGGAARDPSTPRGDGLSTDEWAKRRRAQMAAKRG